MQHIDYKITHLKTQRPVVRFQLEEIPTWRTKESDFTISLSGKFYAKD